MSRHMQKLRFCACQATSASDPKRTVRMRVAVAHSLTRGLGDETYPSPGVRGLEHHAIAVSVFSCLPASPLCRSSGRARSGLTSMRPQRGRGRESGFIAGARRWIGSHEASQEPSCQHAHLSRAEPKMSEPWTAPRLRVRVHSTMSLIDFLAMETKVGTCV